MEGVPGPKVKSSIVTWKHGKLHLWSINTHLPWLLQGDRGQRGEVGPQGVVGKPVSCFFLDIFFSKNTFSLSQRYIFIFRYMYFNVFKQGSKGERGPIGVPGAQGLSGTKGDKVYMITMLLMLCQTCASLPVFQHTLDTQTCPWGAVFTHE